MNEATAYRGNQHRPTRDLLEWHAHAPTDLALEPDLPIVDPHHHLFNTEVETHYYRREDMAQDLCSGHRVLGTVYVAAYGAGWRNSGPPAMRSVGEVERIVQLSTAPLQTHHGRCQLAAGIVSEVDLTLGDAIAPVLDAHLAAGKGRLRGVRYCATSHGGALARFIPDAPRNVMADAKFRLGVAHLERHRLSFDALIYHTQLRELAALADTFPDMTIVLNHVGMPVGVLEYESHRAMVRQQWEKDMRSLAKRANVRVKLGGMGMPILGFGFERGSGPASTSTLMASWRPLVQVCLEAFGPSRCMLESNFPVDKQSCSYAHLWNAFKLLTRDLSQSDRHALFYRTACHTYGLTELAAVCDNAVLLKGP
jgi:L-fuconolactonase